MKQIDQMALVKLGESLARLKMLVEDGIAREEARIKAIADAEYDSWSMQEGTRHEQS
jgi:hypothetical protein